MQFAPDTPRRATTVQGLNLQSPAPFTEGHPLTKSEAEVLNQTLSENLRNNFASKLQAKAKETLGEKSTEEEVKAYINGLDIGQVQADFDAYAGTYEFGVRVGGGGRSADPIEKKMREIAETKLNDALKAKGIQKSKLEKGVFNQRVEEFIGKNADALRKMAEKQVREIAKMAAEDVGLG